MSYGVRNVVWEKEIWIAKIETIEASLRVQNTCLDHKAVLSTAKVLLFFLFIKSGSFIEDFPYSSNSCCARAHGVSVGSFLLHFSLFDTNYSNPRRRALIMNNIWISLWTPSCKARSSGRFKLRNVLQAKRAALWLLRLQKSAKRWQKINRRPYRRLVRMWQIFWRIFHLQWGAFQAFAYLCVSIIEYIPTFAFVSTLKCPVRTISAAENCD